MSWKVDVIDTSNRQQEKFVISTEELSDDLFVVRAKDGMRQFQAHVDSQRCAIITDGILTCSELLQLVRKRFNINVTRSPRTTKRLLDAYSSRSSWLGDSADNSISADQPTGLSVEKYMRIRIPWKAAVAGDVPTAVAGDTSTNTNGSVVLHFDIFLFEQTDSGESFTEKVLKKLDSIGSMSRNRSRSASPALASPSESPSRASPQRTSTSPTTLRVDTDFSDDTHSARGSPSSDRGRSPARASGTSPLASIVGMVRAKQLGHKKLLSLRAQIAEAEGCWTSDSNLNAMDSRKYIRWSGSQEIKGIEIFSRIFHDEEIVFLQSAVYEVLVSARVPSDAAELVQLELHLDGHLTKQAPASSPEFGTPRSAVARAVAAAATRSPARSATLTPKSLGSQQQTPRPRSRSRGTPKSTSTSPSPTLVQAVGKQTTVRKTRRKGQASAFVEISRKFVVAAARGQSIGAKVVPMKVCLKRACTTPISATSRDALHCSVVSSTRF